MKRLAIEAVNFYQNFLSLPLKMLLGQNRFCYQYPSCSEFTKEAIEKKGVFLGIILGMKRILSCRPVFKYD